MLAHEPVESSGASWVCVMSAQFWPCPGCSRHVKRGDAVCPFCGATASIEISPRPTIAARLSRASLFAVGAVGAAFATTNCSSNPYGQPPYYPTGIEGSGASNNSSPTDASSDMSTDAADASATTLPTDSSSAADVPMAVPFYGAAVGPDE
jgi:hypothetical protein